MTDPAQLPRIAWRLKIPIGAMVSGALGGLGLLIFLQQAAVAYPTRNFSLALVVGGVLGALVLRNVASMVGVARLNRRLGKLDAQMGRGAPGAAPSSSGEWNATHAVPAGGMTAWAEADPTGEAVARIDEGVEFQLLEQNNGLAHVKAYNGWTAWVDASSLVEKG